MDITPQSNLIMSINSILIAANNYPTATDPVHTFLEQIAVALSKRGIKVTVIAPSRIVQHFLRHTELHPKFREITVENGKTITVYQPRYITLGNRFENFNMWSARRAVCKIASKINNKPDVCYGYFWHWAWAIYPYAKTSNLPLITHTGETPVILHDFYTEDKLKSFKEYVKGVVCNSSFCKQLSIDAKLADDSKCEIFPNGINSKIFYPRDKQKLRADHGIKENDFVIAYTGWFNDNKGSVRVSNAIKKLNDTSIKSIFVGVNQDGNGNYEPTCEGIIFKGRLPHAEIPEWLSMADVFVFPTQHEGSSNVIVEAMACGLPIISSDRMFNWDVLDENNSILIDPMNVDEIAAAIKTLKDNNQKREIMSQRALETAEGLTIEKRVERIVKFIESRI